MMQVLHALVLLHLFAELYSHGFAAPVQAEHKQEGYLWAT